MKTMAERYTDESLQADIDAGGYGAGGMHPRQAVELIKVPAEHRERVYWEANTLCNINGGNLSGNIYYARTEFMRNLEAGEPEKELYGENFARVAREREAELRKITGDPGAIYNPFL